jgi:hypothetical protein
MSIVPYFVCATPWIDDLSTGRSFEENKHFVFGNIETRKVFYLF